MRVMCPQCKGERRYYRLKPQPTMPISNHADMTASSEMTCERELVDCDKCSGAGVVERTEPVPVFQSGQKIGTVPVSFHPSKIRSASFWYVPRVGDFWQVGDTLVASDMLGPGDLDAVPGFVWDR